MGEELLVSELIDSGADFVREFDSYRPVSVACWVNPTDSTNLFLYVASDEIDDTNIRIAYGEVLRRAKLFPWLDPFQVKLVNSSDPIARDAMEIRDRSPLATHYGGSSMGGMSIDSAYIYPPLSVMKATS